MLAVDRQPTAVIKNRADIRRRGHARSRSRSAPIRAMTDRHFHRCLIMHLTRAGQHDTHESENSNTNHTFSMEDIMAQIHDLVIRGAIVLDKGPGQVLDRFLPARVSTLASAAL
jgi:hypothetical protein